MRGDRYSTVLEPLEREQLGNLASVVAEALIQRARSAPKDELAELTGLPSGHKEPPEDPSLARLLPNFERDEDQEFDGDNALLRSFHESDITRAKLEHLQVVIEKLGPDGGVHVTLEEAEAHAWVAALNDLRLYVAAGSTGENAQMLVEWLAYNQDSLLNAMMGE